MRQEMDIVADLTRADQGCECPVDAPGQSLVVLTAEEVAGTSLQDCLLHMQRGFGIHCVCAGQYLRPSLLMKPGTIGSCEVGASGGDILFFSVLGEKAKDIVFVVL